MYALEIDANKFETVWFWPPDAPSRGGQGQGFLHRAGAGSSLGRGLGPGVWSKGVPAW